jgi:hypothetical protein
MSNKRYKNSGEIPTPAFLAETWFVSCVSQHSFFECIFLAGECNPGIQVLHSCFVVIAVW